LRAYALLGVDAPHVDFRSYAPHVDLRAYALLGVDAPHVDFRSYAPHVALRAIALHVELRAYALTR